MGEVVGERESNQHAPASSSPQSPPRAVAANDLAKSLLNQNKYDQELHWACPRRVRRAIRPG